jgi:hypothetical protein
VQFRNHGAHLTVTQGQVLPPGSDPPASMMHLFRRLPNGQLQMVRWSGRSPMVCDVCNGHGRVKPPDRDPDEPRSHFGGIQVREPETVHYIDGPDNPEASDSRADGDRHGDRALAQMFAAEAVRARERWADAAFREGIARQFDADARRRRRLLSFEE